MQFKAELDDTGVQAQLAAIGPNVRQALVAALTPISVAMVADAKARAEAHIHTLGIKPGSYVASIKGGVADEKDGQISMWIGSKWQAAGLLEYGAFIPAHDILPDAAKALHFTGSAGEVFAKIVHSPGADVPAYPAIIPAFEAAQGDIMAAIQDIALGAGDL